MIVIASEFRLEVLKIAYEYEVWLRANGRGSSYSTFCDEFGYENEDRGRIYSAVEKVRRCALAEAVG